MRHTHPRLAVALALVALAAGCNPPVPPPKPPVPTAPSGVVEPTPPSQATTAPAATPSTAATPGTPAASPTVGAGKLSGIVLNYQRDPIAGATISARAAGKEAGSATAGADGRYTLTLPPGDYEVTATKAGFTTRTQAVKVPGETRLDFGPAPDDAGNPYFLAPDPEVERVELKEDDIGGPLTLTLHFSEPLTAESQKNFESAFELRSSTSIEFLRAVGMTALRVRPSTAWEQDGKVFVFKYAGPYLASGVTNVTYSATLRQDQRAERDPETREFLWEDLGIVDKDGFKLGRGRRDYMFKKPTLHPLSADQLTDTTYGYYTQDRRWNLTHESLYTFAARRDDVPPFAESVEAEVEEQIGADAVDLVKLRFNEPMRVAKERDEMAFTRLNVSLKQFIVNVSTDPGGKAPVPLGDNVKPKKIEIDPDDPRIVYLHFPVETFKDYEWLEITLTSDFQDPAGNKPDPRKNKIAGPVL